MVRTLERRGERHPPAPFFFLFRPVGPLLFCHSPTWTGLAWVGVWHPDALQLYRLHCRGQLPLIPLKGVHTANLEDTPDSNSPVPAHDLRSSAVIRVATSQPTFELLVDELLVRLRCLVPPKFSRARTCRLYGLGEELTLRSIVHEAHVFWLSNRLDRLNLNGRRLLVNELLQRTATDAAIASLAVLGAVPFAELTLHDIEVTETWVDVSDCPSRNIRDALVLRVWLPWFAANSAEILGGKLRQWLRSTNPYLARAALVLSVGFVHKTDQSHLEPVMRAVVHLPEWTNCRQNEVDSAIGWLLANLWPIEPALVQNWVSIHGSKLPRNAFRLAVGRMPTPTRNRLTIEWKSRRV